MSGLTIFNYGDTPITFMDANGQQMINATQMAKAVFKEKGIQKNPKDYLKNKSTVEFMGAVANRRILPFEDLAYVIEGSPANGGGTWMQEDIALDFAQWLDVDLKLWCNDRLKELITTGSVRLTPQDAMPKSYSEALRVIADLIDENDSIKRRKGIETIVNKSIKPKIDSNRGMPVWDVKTQN